jgi:hypothetical protein
MVMRVSKRHYLWYRHVPRGNSAIGLALCLVIAAGLAAIVVESHAVPLGFKAILCVFVAATCWGAYAFGKWVLWPPLALAATEEGVLSFYNEKSDNYGTTSILIPWADIDSFRYETRVIVRRRLPSLLVRVAADGSHGSNRTLVFHVWSETGGKRMVDELTNLHRRFKRR